MFLRRLSRWQAEGERDDVADLYVEAMRDVPGPRPLDRGEFARRFVDHVVQQPGFDMMVAGDPALAGSAYGHRADRGGPWWESYQEVPVELDELTSARQVFAVAGLLVAPRQRRNQVGTRMLSELLARADASLAIAVLDPGNVPALTAFQSWGWTKAGQLTPRDAAPPLEAWARRLGR
ncbi:GNAT family N-acetyltransferase [Streptomyces sp. B6B3]|uniref:GNAT family N-acetyltransferase n=1 Tax=Streptomyces sp. B6B3 TaxID=3153570 RepID=UPI00325E5844